jgi:hypothetical protein
MAFCIRGATFQVATSAPLPTFFEECRYESRHGSLEGRSTVPWQGTPLAPRGAQRN